MSECGMKQTRDKNDARRLTLRDERKKKNFAHTTDHKGKNATLIYKARPLMSSSQATQFTHASPQKSSNNQPEDSEGEKCLALARAGSYAATDFDRRAHLGILSRAIGCTSLPCVL